MKVVGSHLGGQRMDDTNHVRLTPEVIVLEVAQDGCFQK